MQKSIVDKYSAIIETKRRNDELDVCIKTLVVNRTKTMDHVVQWENICHDYSTRITSLDVRIETNKEKIDKIKKLEHEVHIMSMYDQAMNDKHGIISKIIAQKCETIKQIWNQKLAVSTNFTIDIDFDKEKFNVRLVEGDCKKISVDVASGFQRFILDLTFRETMYKLAQCVLPEFIIIDEGFGTADEVNRSMIKHYLQSLANEYKFVVIISHIDEFQYIANHKLTIEKCKTGSRIRYPAGSIIEPIDVGADHKDREAEKNKNGS